MMGRELSVISQSIAQGQVAQIGMALVNLFQSFWKDVECSWVEPPEPDRLFNQANWVSRIWGGIGTIELRQVDATQCLVSYYLPPYPDALETERFETVIRAAISPDAFSFRMLDLGPRDPVRAYLSAQLQKHRLQRFNQLRGEVSSTLKMLPFQSPSEPAAATLRTWEGTNQPVAQTDPERNWELPIAQNRSPENNLRRTQKDELLLSLWTQGHAAKEIAERIGISEKTVLNRLSLLRRSLGDQAVIRRK